ncbi:MAG TPA: penicillin-binding protein 2, partial [Thermoanaerobaculia bacterium]|nr:penicillin-binding protein 2 [Thermoanaerobaculia bacterium]
MRPATPQVPALPQPAESARAVGRERRTRRRLWAVLAMGLVWIGILAWRLFELQVERHGEFSERAQRQQRRVLELDAPRGTIYDLRGRELAVSVPAQTVFADPSRLEDRARAAADLATALRLDRLERRDLERRLQRDSEFVFVARKVEPEAAERVRALGLRGVGLLEESRRIYPRGEVAAHVLGFVGTDNHGLAGLESTWDREIAGETVRRQVLRDARRTLVVAPAALDAAARAGADLHLTLDATLQYLAEKELRAAVERFDAPGGVIVLLDARDSAVLAMASYPSFDPNRFGAFSQESWRNRAVMDAYEPGSTFKMVTAAAALESLAIHPDDRLDCEMGGITLAGTFIGDHKPFGTLTFREVIARSSNVGVIKAALRTGTDRVYGMTAAFGFGRPTGIDLPGESAGILRPRERWVGLTTAYAAFGHGLSATPIQLANAYAALANGGSWHRPYVVRGTSRDGRYEPVRRPAPERLPFGPGTQQTLVRLLEGVVETGGTGRGGAVPGYRVAGKTGTAEKSDHRGYSATGRIASFVAFVP